MKGTLTTIKPDGERTVVTLDRAATLDDLRAAIGGGYIEFVPYLERFEGVRAQAICDEEGKLNGLPLNAIATKYWPASIRAGDVLVGDVCFITGDDAFMEAL